MTGRWPADARATDVTKQSETREPRARPDRAARRRRRDPVGAPAQRRARRLALTVRAALDDLVREGLLVRRHGSGTFVSEPKIAQELTMTSFTEDMQRRGMVPGSRTLDLRVIAGRGAPRAPAARLPVGAGRDHQTGFGWPIARRWRSRRCTCGSRSCPASTAARPRASSRSTSSSRTASGSTIVGGLQTIEPTVTNEDGVRGARRARCTRRRSCSSARRAPRAARSSSSFARSTAATATSS